MHRKTIQGQRSVIRHAGRRRHGSVQRVANLRTRFRRNGHSCGPALKDAAVRNIRARDDGCGQRIRPPNRRERDAGIGYDKLGASIERLRSVVPSRKRMLCLAETCGCRQNDLRPHKRIDRRGCRTFATAKGKRNRRQRIERDFIQPYAVLAHIAFVHFVFLVRPTDSMLALFRDVKDDIRPIRLTANGDTLQLIVGQHSLRFSVKRQIGVVKYLSVILFARRLPPE